MTDKETPRRIQLNKMIPAELAIYNAIQEVEKIGADVRLTNAIIHLQDAKNLVGDFIDNLYQEKPESKTERLFLLQYHLSRRQDEGWNNIALVSAVDFEEAKKKLISNKEYEYRDALDCRMVTPDHITNLNID